MKNRHPTDTGEYFFSDFQPTQDPVHQTSWLGELKALLGIAVQCFVTTLLIMVVLLLVAVMLDKVALAEPVEAHPVVETAKPATAFVSSCRSIKDCA